MSSKSPPSPVTSLLHQDFSKSGLKGKKQKQKQKMAGYAPEWNHRMPMTFPRFFSNLDIEKLRKIRRHYIIERTLNICKITKFESDTS